MNARRQRTGTEHHRQVLRLLFGKCTSNLHIVANLIINRRGLANAVIENDREPIVQVRTREFRKTPSALVAQMGIDIWTTILIAAGLRVTNVAASHGSRANTT